MQLSRLDEIELFSLTLWRSERGWTAGAQRQAGDQVRYATAAKASEAIAAVLPIVPPLPVPAPIVPPLPY